MKSSFHRIVLRLLLVGILGSGVVVKSFSIAPTIQHIGSRRTYNNNDDNVSSSALYKKKGRFSQVELVKIAELARQQRLGIGNEDKELTAEEIQQKNDRLRFGEMLKENDGLLLSKNDHHDESLFDVNYISEEDEREMEKALKKGDKLRFVDDPAPAEPFETLASVQSKGEVLGKSGASRVVPWLGAKSDDYLIIISDPRPTSFQLRDTIEVLSTNLPRSVRDKLIYINADSYGTNKKWLKKSNMSISTASSIYIDEGLHWMRAYSALGTKRYSMTLVIIQNERIKTIKRELDDAFAEEIILSAIEEL